MDLQIPIDKDHCNKAIITALSIFTNFTEYEINILTAMLNTNTKVLNIETRKNIRDTMKTDQFTFNNYVSKLKSRGALVQKSNKEYTINPKILEAVKDKQINIRFHVT